MRSLQAVSHREGAYYSNNRLIYYTFMIWVSAVLVTSPSV